METRSCSPELTVKEALTQALELYKLCAEWDEESSTVVAVPPGAEPWHRGEHLTVEPLDQPGGFERSAEEHIEGAAVILWAPDENGVQQRMRTIRAGRPGRFLEMEAAECARAASEWYTSPVPSQVLLEALGKMGLPAIRLRRKTIVPLEGEASSVEDVEQQRHLVITAESDADDRLVPHTGWSVWYLTPAAATPWLLFRTSLHLRSGQAVRADTLAVAAYIANYPVTAGKAG
ncbi:hypothetical protein [Streptomyces smyrnaeus]|uniref:hypothetical protein n=1 Tax=Streptomyces smyrnaeus TaxID=1387713 RepID=UPI0033F86B21